MNVLDFPTVIAKLNVQIETDQSEDQPYGLVRSPRNLCAIRVNDVLVHELVTRPRECVVGKFVE